MNNPSFPPDDFAGRLRALLAEGRFKEAVDEYRGAEGRPMPAEAQLLAATAATRMGDLGSGASLAESAMGRFRARADDDGRMRALNLLGVIEFERGNLERSRRCFTEALELARSLRDTLMTARASNNLASLADLQGVTGDALSLYRSALLSYQRLGDRRGAAEAYHNLGIVFRQMGEWHDAESAASQAVRYAENLNERSLMGIAVMGRAEIALRRGELGLARQQLAWADSLTTQTRDELAVVEIGLLRGQLNLAEGHASDAVSEAERARSLALDLKAAVLQAQCAALAALGWKAQGRETEAEERRAEAVRLFEAQGARARLDDFQEQWEGGAP